jgi:hypothetical protein
MIGSASALQAVFNPAAARAFARIRLDGRSAYD